MVILIAGQQGAVGDDKNWPLALAPIEQEGS